jgi:hypothetical protein
MDGVDNTEHTSGFLMYGEYSNKKQMATSETLRKILRR